MADLAGSREMQRVREGRRQVLVACPGCREVVGLWLCILPPGEYQQMHPTTDLTASLLPPDQRADAMRRAAELAEKSAAVPWVTCSLCGYDDQYTFGVPA